MTERRIEVLTPGGAYEVVIGRGLLERAGERMRAVTGARRAALITDETVAPLFGMTVDVALARAGFEVTSLVIAAGETSKTWQGAGELLEELARAGLDRASVVCALGGGVVGDLAGFVAAVYLRGIDLVQVPTTLLAMVDSSIGGKTGVDLLAGKNLAGAFKQPLLVLADVSTLSTLPDSEWRSGLAEIAKSAVIAGEDFFAWLERNAEGLAARDEALVSEAIERSVRFKASVVGRDERESGLRECLNYGHTLGHALELVLGYGTLPHGVAVAEGMRFAARVAVEVVGAPIEFVRRQDALLDALGLSALEDVVVAPAVVHDAMRTDKKARSGAVRMVLASGPGVWRCTAVEDAVLAAHLEQWAWIKRGE